MKRTYSQLLMELAACILLVGCMKPATVKPLPAVHGGNISIGIGMPVSDMSSTATLAGAAAIPPPHKHHHAKVKAAAIQSGAVSDTSADSATIDYAASYADRATTATSTMSAVDKIVNDLPWGNIAFDTPNTMTFDEEQTVTLLLSNTMSQQQLKDQLASQETDSAKVKTSDVMEAQLTGVGFKITAVDPDRQVIAEGDPVKWTWTVVPTQYGSESLHLTLSARLSIDGQHAPLVVRTFDRNIQVKITPKQRITQFIAGNWQWLWATVVFPLGGLLWAQRKRRRNSPDIPI